MEFGRRNFGNTVLFNFHSSPGLKRIFDGDLTPKRLVTELSAYAQETITDETLIIFDEVQECDRAVASLRYFSELSPWQPIISTGSMLGLLTGSPGGRVSFPTGRVEQVHMHPMDMEEFAWAVGERGLTDSIRDHFGSMGEMPLHEEAMELYRRYLAVGGMPAAVKTYADTGDPELTRDVLRNLDSGFLGDISKHADSPDTVVKTLRTWNSMTSQLLKDNLKFQYNRICSGARSKQYSLSVDWLTAAGMVDRCDKVTEPLVPLSGYADPDSFRLFFGDVGVMCQKAEVPFRAVVTGRVSDRFRGVMAENYVMQSLTANGLRPYYWNPDQNTELDFVFQNDAGEIVPVEVKSGEGVSSKSMDKFRSRYGPERSVRISSRNFGVSDGLYSIPLYAAFCLDGGFGSLRRLLMPYVPDPCCGCHRGDGSYAIWHIECFWVMKDIKLLCA